MRRLLPLALLVVAVGCMPTTIFAETGVVLMHGKWGTSLPRSPIGGLARSLRDAGFLVVTPEMPWSRHRLYDRDLAGAFREIDAAVAVLRRRGATRIVVGGHSLGANVAIAYGTSRGGLSGILAIAPGHRPEGRRFAAANAASVRAAKLAIAGGNTGRLLAVIDINQGRERSFRRSAKIVVDYFAPDGPTVMPRNAPRLSRGTPILWIIGERDRLAPAGRGYAFARFPANRKSSYIVVRGGHRATPRIGRREIVDWLRGL